MKTNRISRVIALFVAALMCFSLLPTMAFAADDITVYVDFEGYNLGQGYYVEPTAITVPAGSTVAQAMDALLTQKGCAYKSLGTLTSSSFYLQRVQFPQAAGTITLPQYILDWDYYEFFIEDDLGVFNYPGWLSETDHCMLSGWVYTINHVVGQVGAGAYTLSDGDVVRWQFTLTGITDLGFGDADFGPALYETSDKTELLREICKDGISPVVKQAALDVAIDPLATAAQVADAIKAIKLDTQWIVIDAPDGALLAKIQQILVDEYDQTAGSYDYSVVKKLKVTGAMATADYTALRTELKTAVIDLDISESTGTVRALNGMTALKTVIMPGRNLPTSDAFSGNTALEHVTFLDNISTLGSNTSRNFNNCSSLKTITFMGNTPPAIGGNNIFTGSSNASAAARKVIAYVPDKTSGGYQNTAFSQYFASVQDISYVPPAEEYYRQALASVIAEAEALTESDFVAAGWTTLQSTLTTVKAVYANTDSTKGAVMAATTAMINAINGLVRSGASCTYIKVTKDATVGVFRKGSAHYAEFAESYTLTKEEAMCDAQYDVYSAVLPLSTGLHVEAYIHGETIKQSKRFSFNTHGKTIRLDLTPLSEWEPVDNTYMNAGLYTNLGNSGSVDLATAEEFYLDTFRVWQAMEGVTENYFIEPDYTFELSGDSVAIERVGNPGRERLKITALKPGVSVVKVTYSPVEYITTIANTGAVSNTLRFNAIDERNTGAVVINVDGGGSIATGITARNDFDTFFFDKKAGYREYTFTPAADSSVRVHDPLNISAWGTGWNDYTANADGSFTVKLKDGRNIIEIKNGTDVTYYVLKARGVSVSVTNSTNPGKPFNTGDVAKIVIRELEEPIEKMSGLYNPGFGAGNFPYLRYTDGTENFDSNNGGQYTPLTDTFTINATMADPSKNVFNGQMYCGVIFGGGYSLGSHRSLSGAGAGPSVGGGVVGDGSLWFGALPEIVLETQDDFDIKAAKTLVSNVVYTATQAEADDAAAAKLKVETLIAALDLNGVDAVVTDGVFIPATAGAVGNLTGADGSYGFTVALNKGTGAEQTYSGMLTITATSYDATQDNLDITAVKTLVSAVTYTATQAEADDITDAKTKVEALIAALALNGVDAVVTDGTFTPAAAGTTDDLDGTDGSYTFSVTLDKGAGTTQTYSGTLAITATAYDPAQDNLDITAVKTLVSSVSYTATQADVADAAAAKLKVETLIAALDLNGVDAVVTDGIYIPAIAGTSVSTSGTNGSYTFTVALNKGAGTEQTYSGTLSITATAYNAPPVSDYETVMNAALAKILQDVPAPAFGTSDGEWSVLALKRADATVPSSYFDDYYTGIIAEISDAAEYPNAPKLHNTKSTENARLILALTAMGKDVTDVGGYNLLAPLADFDWVKKQGINGAIFALIALDSNKYDIPIDSSVADQTTREKLIDYILAQEVSGGGFSLAGITAEVDMTAMALQALASYQDIQDVADVTDRALAVLSALQSADGIFGTASESTAQVIVALTALGIDPTDDVRFVKANGDPITALLGFEAAGGGFKHLATQLTADGMATDQGAYALVAYDRFLNGKTALYDMTDMFTQTPVTPGSPITVSLSYQADNSGFVIARKSFTVAPDLSENYGYNDIFAGAKVSALDAVVAAHIAVYGDSKAVINSKLKLDNGAYGDFISSFMGDDAGNMLYYVNGASPWVGAPEQEVFAGDLIELFTARETLTWSDQYGYFTDGTAKIETLTVKANQAFTLTLATEVTDWGTMATTEEPVANANIVKVTSGSGIDAIFSSLSSTTDADGKVTIKLTEAGTYVLSATEKSGTTPLMAPWLVVTVQSATAPPVTPSTPKVNVSFRLIGSTRSDGDVSLTSGDYKGAEYVTWIATKSYSMNEGDTVYDLFVKAIGDAGLSAVGHNKNYVESITAPKALGGYVLGEFTNGQYSGWMYTINGQHPGYGLKERVLKAGDKIVWHYVNDYRYEVADWFGDAGHPSLGNGDLHNKWLGAADKNPSSSSTGGTGTGGATATPKPSATPTPAASPAPTPGGPTSVPDNKWVNPFIDVNIGDWFYGAVEYVNVNGLMNGTSANSFEPAADVTRAMLVTMLYRLEGEPTAPGENPFSDVESAQWYTNAIIWASESGIVEGFGEGIFAPNDALTREQIAAILYRYSAGKGFDITNSAELSDYADMGDISDWAAQAMQWANAEGIISGRSATELAPKGTANRAEVATMIMRYIEKIVQ